MAVTEVENTGCMGRMIGALFGIGFGMLLLLAGPMLLFWNEGRAVKTSAAIAEGASSAVHVEASAIDSAKDGALVHLNGVAQAEGELTDAPFGVKVSAIRLERTVEMYQWEQDTESRTEKKLGGGKKRTKTYTYGKVWSDDLIDSTRFKEQKGHHNPKRMPYEEEKQVASTVTVGAFTLDDTLKGMIGGAVDLDLTAENVAASQWATGGGKLVDGELYIGVDPTNPAIGDVRVGFRVVENGPVSVLGRQQGNVLGKHVTSNGYAVHDVSRGTKTMAEMFESQESTNSILTWLLRPVGFVMVFLGITAILGPARVMADVVPFMGRIAGFMIGVVAFLGAAACTLPTIGIAWVFYRPMIGIALLVVGTLFLFALLGAMVVAFRMTASEA